MDLWANLAQGFAVALTFSTLMLAVGGCFIGTIIGSLPGLGPSNGVAILIPLAFSLGLDATEALVLMTSVYYGAMYGGRISSILLNIPGDEPALMTTLDGYPMARQGPGRRRAGAVRGRRPSSAPCSPPSASCCWLPILARIAFLFGPAEYFALYLLAFCTLGGLASKNQAKAALAAAIRARARDDRARQPDRDSRGSPSARSTSWTGSTSWSPSSACSRWLGDLHLHGEPREGFGHRGQAGADHHSRCETS